MKVLGSEHALFSALARTHRAYCGIASGASAAGCRAAAVPHGCRPGCWNRARPRVSRYRRRGGGRFRRLRCRRRVVVSGRRRLRCGGRPLFREPRERVENVQTTPAANIALRNAQIRRGHDQGQGAFRADGEHSVACAAVPPSPKTDPTLANPEGAHIKPCIVGECHLGRFLLHEARQDQRARRPARCRRSRARAPRAGPESMFASRRSAPRGIAAARVAEPHPLAQPIRARVVARGDERLRDRCRSSLRTARRAAARPAPTRRSRSRNRPPSPSSRRMRVEPFEAQRRGRVRAGAEGEPGSIRTTAAPGSSTCSWCGQIHSRRRSAWRGSRAAIRAPRRDRPPRARAGALGVAGRARGSARDDCRRDRHRGWKQCLDARRRPEPELSGRRLEDRRGVAIVRIDERHGERAAGEAGLLRRRPPQAARDPS